MPLELHIIRASEFVRLGARGHFDLATSKAALAELAHACHKRGVERALIDLRDLHPGPKPVFSPADLSELVSTFQQVGFSKDQRLAVLYKSDPHGRTRMFSMISVMHGWQVRCFQDFEKAVTWLSEEQTATVASGDPEPGVPVRIRRPSPPSAKKKAL